MAGEDGGELIVESKFILIFFNPKSFFNALLLLNEIKYFNERILFKVNLGYL